ncbi:MAG TPA: hypothetical protein VND65_15600 [Candidatus Binatia bacterium]|nr:hypothetical protein [Candidatus Binatia bacterium]
MAANPTLDVEPTTEVVEKYHIYHGEARVISGELEHPVKQPIKEYGNVVLDHTRREGHLFESVGPTSIEGLISFRSGYTRVSGNYLKNKKDLWGNDHSGWVTLSTSVIEGLNVFEVITADRVVAQVYTEHPHVDGHVPKVSFIGTRFENLKVAGYPVEAKFNFKVCGDRPADDQPYLMDNGFLQNVSMQMSTILGSTGLPAPLEKQYTAELKKVNGLKQGANGNGSKAWKGSAQLQCSLVEKIGPIPGAEIFGNLIFIPDFGIVSLAQLEVGVEEREERYPNPVLLASRPRKDSSYFRLHMLSVKMGCVGTTNQTNVATAGANGQTHP